jgi:hypothetical protein
MKRGAAFAAVVFTVLALASTSLARQLKGHRHAAHTSLAQPDQVIGWNQAMLNCCRRRAHSRPRFIPPPIAVWSAVRVERSRDPMI